MPRELLDVLKREAPRERERRDRHVGGRGGDSALGAGLERLAEMPTQTPITTRLALPRLGAGEGLASPDRGPSMPS